LYLVISASASPNRIAKILIVFKQVNTSPISHWLKK